MKLDRFLKAAAELDAKLEFIDTKTVLQTAVFNAYSRALGLLAEKDAAEWAEKVASGASPYETTTEREEEAEERHAEVPAVPEQQQDATVPLLSLLTTDEHVKLRTEFALAHGRNFHSPEEALQAGLAAGLDAERIFVSGAAGKYFVQPLPEQADPQPELDPLQQRYAEKHANYQKFVAEQAAANPHADPKSTQHD